MKMENAPSGDGPLINLNPLRQCSLAAEEVLKELGNLLSSEIGEYSTEDTSFVVFGSLARREWIKTKSDLDWTFLIDGQANSDHLRIAQSIQRIVNFHPAFKGPGQTGTFGNMAFSHELIHQIGGQHDANRNMTQRILLLLESQPIGRGDAYERVVTGVISRYLEEDNHLLTQDGKNYRVPRFLLNDIVRFWRTMAVDFASKQRDRAGEGWGIRNAKLRMSRKLIFASGLLVCFGCQLDQELRSRISTSEDDIRLNLVNHIKESVRLTPLEILARAVRSYGVPQEIGDKLFSAYADFLDLLNSPARESLAQLRAEASRSDATFARVREISERFEHALSYIFFDHPIFSDLTRKYGVF